MVTKVKVARETLLAQLQEAKKAAVKRTEARFADFEVQKDVAKEQILLAASALSRDDDETFHKLENVVATYWSYDIRKRSLEKEVAATEEKYDKAIKLVEISSDTTFTVGSDSEFGYLLGL